MSSSGVAGMVFEYISYTLSCPVCPPFLTPHFPYIFYTSLSTWCSVSVSVSLLAGTCESPILLSTFLSSLLLTCPYHFSRFSVIFFVTGATFTDPVMCSFLSLSLFVTPHIHLGSIISFTISLFSWLYVVDHVSVPYSDAGIITVLYYTCTFSVTGTFLRTTLHCTSSNFPMRHSSSFAVPSGVMISRPCRTSYQSSSFSSISCVPRDSLHAFRHPFCYVTAVRRIWSYTPSLPTPFPLYNTHHPPSVIVCPK